MIPGEHGNGFEAWRLTEGGAFREGALDLPYCLLIYAFPVPGMSSGKLELPLPGSQAGAGEPGFSGVKCADDGDDLGRRPEAVKGTTHPLLFRSSSRV